MTWIKLDDNAVDHPKVASLTDRAFRWWVKGLSYASRLLTDGLLPPTFWKPVPKQTRSELTSAKLWDWDDPNFRIHDYLSHQSSRDAVTQKRADNVERVTRYRERKRNALQARDSNAVVTPPETDTETENRDREEQERPPTPLKPLISGEASSVGWWKIHGSHTEGFCDWVCLPEFLFAEFCRKSGQVDQPDGGVAYVRGWAAKVRECWSGPVGDNLKFWRDRWAESHPTKKPAEKPFSVADAIARETARRAAK